MKKVHFLLLKSFIGPFAVSFFVALLVLLMQFLWKYIDDLVGKGLEWYIVIEFLFYASASMIVLALPLAVLISSIMCLGNLSEHYELTALKSAGNPLYRILSPLFFAVLIISIGAFLFSNYALPYSNLKFKSLLYDITKQKPAFNIKEGSFYSGFDGYSIRIGKKEDDGKTIRDVMLYDHTSGKGNDNVVIAEWGEMFYSADGKYLFLNLKDGHQYQEEFEGRNNQRSVVQNRQTFKSMDIIFDLSTFDLSRLDEKLFKSHYSMLNLNQLDIAMDSIETSMGRRLLSMQINIQPYLYYKKLRMDSLDFSEAATINADSLFANTTTEQISRALTMAKSVRTYSKANYKDHSLKKISLAKHKIEWHRKFTLALACLLLFLVGAPLGAIARKGGLGIPLILATIFFITYFMLSSTGEKQAKLLEWIPEVGMWFSTVIFIPIAAFFMYKATNDSKLVNLDGLIAIFKRIGKILQFTR